MSRQMERRLTEIEFKPKSGLWRAWRCSLCANIFASLPHTSNTTDGKAPQCCPYCGQIFDCATELG